MAKKKESYDFLVPWCGNKVPWSLYGSEETYNGFDETTGTWKKMPIDWRENKPFKASFKVKEFTGSTSSTQVLMVNTATDEEFIMREVDFLEALKQTAVVHGVFIGEWIFRKTSHKYYGLKLWN